MKLEAAECISSGGGVVVCAAAESEDRVVNERWTLIERVFFSYTENSIFNKH